MTKLTSLFERRVKLVTLSRQLSYDAQRGPSAAAL